MNYVAATMVLKFPDREDLARRRFAEAMLLFGGLWLWPQRNLQLQLNHFLASSSKVGTASVTRTCTN
eukprot:1554903-Amphidinium_carterae.1